MSANISSEVPSLPYAAILSSLDLIALPLAVLDLQGLVVFTNRAWQQAANKQQVDNHPFVANAHPFLTRFQIRICPQTPGIVGGIMSLLKNNQTAFLLEYSWLANNTLQWFSLRAQQLDTKKHILIQQENITAQKRANIALDESEEQFRIAFEHSLIGMALVGIDGSWLQVNQSLCDSLGYTKEELIGKTFQEFTHPDDLESNNVLVRRAVNGKLSNYQIEKRYIHKDGSIVWGHVSSILIRDFDQKPLYFVVQMQNITDRYMARLESQRQTSFIETLQAVAIAANEADSIEDAMQTAIKQICQQIGWSIGHVYLSLPNQTGVLESSKQWYFIDEERFGSLRHSTQQLIKPNLNHVVGRVMLTKQSEWQRDPEMLPQFDSVQLKTACAFPVFLGSEVVAILEFFSTESLEPDRTLLEVMEHVGSQLGRVVERVRARDAMWRSEQLYRTAANNFPNGALMLFDRDMRYTAAGGVALAEMGLDRHNIEGRTIYELLPVNICSMLVPAYQAALAGLEYSQELTFRGHTYQMYTIPLFNERDEVYAGMSIAQNITERKHFERALMEERALLTRRVEERTADLSAANAELAKVARLKDEFLASMSHELRTPLNAVLGLSEALQEEVYGLLNPAQLKTLKSIEESGRHLLDLINDILDLAKIGAGKFELSLSPVELHTICHASLRLIRQEAQKKNITIETHIDSKVDIIQADARRLKQVLLNLLSNAIKFTPFGGTVGLEVDGDSVDQMVRIAIRDSGIGIAAEDMPRLFQPFVQLDSRLARQYNGTGLGLVLVYRMVEMHGGSVTVVSEVGKGSCFTVTLPWNNQLRDNLKSNSLALNATETYPAIRKVLIVEDSPTSAAQLVRYLDELGVAAVTHSQGEGTLKQVIEHQPDLIVLDVLLPDTSGWEVLERLKAESLTQGIPVVIMSVMDDRAYGLHLGAVEYLVKPFTRQDVQHILQRLMHTDKLDAPANPQDEATASPIVLLAEDNEASIATMFDYLTVKGYQVVVARNGTEAIARAHEIQPSVILMDIQMPGMDGLEAIKRIRTQSVLSRIPIIALTALAMPGDQERCIQAGASSYMSKPVSLRGLVSEIERHLKEQPAQ
jgi:PAS domain S-box-containing protein